MGDLPEVMLNQDLTPAKSLDVEDAVEGPGHAGRQIELAFRVHSEDDHLLRAFVDQGDAGAVDLEIDMGMDGFEGVLEFADDGGGDRWIEDDGSGARRRPSTGSHQDDEEEKQADAAGPSPR